jgi:hypothetical protein
MVAQHINAGASRIEKFVYPCGCNLIMYTCHESSMNSIFRQKMALDKIAKNGNNPCLPACLPACLQMTYSHNKWFE